MHIRYTTFCVSDLFWQKCQRLHKKLRRIVWYNSYWWTLRVDFWRIFFYWGKTFQLGAEMMLSLFGSDEVSLRGDFLMSNSIQSPKIGSKITSELSNQWRMNGHWPNYHFTRFGPMAFEIVHCFRNRLHRPILSFQLILDWKVVSNKSMKIQFFCFSWMAPGSVVLTRGFSAWCVLKVARTAWTAPLASSPSTGCWGPYSSFCSASSYAASQLSSFSPSNTRTSR